MRAFIGIKLIDCFDEILKIQKRFKIEGLKGNYTSPENIHITISFLGEINDRQLNTVKNIMNSINLEEFTISLNKIKKMKNMVILEVQINQTLIKLQKEIESQLLKEGFEIQDRKFYPHVTLIRKVEINTYQNIDLHSRVLECILFSSSIIKNTLTYIPIHTIKLRRNQS